MVRMMRFLSNDDAAVCGGCAGGIEYLNLPLLKTPETEVLFDSKHYDWRYNGKDTFTEESSDMNPRGEHFFEEMEDSDHGYTENYQSVGHCPYGSCGDAIYFKGHVLDITGTDVWENMRRGCKIGWLWTIYTDKISAESEAEIAKRYYNQLD